MDARLFKPFILLILLISYSCKSELKKGTFVYQLKQLKPIEGIEVLKSDESMIAVSGPYQGRVFTSSSKGLNGRSYGYFNAGLIENNKHSTNIAYLGGESRVWFAPEFGNYSIFFDANVEQIDENMRAPHDLSNVKFKEKTRTEHSITYVGDMNIKNNHNYTFSIGLERKISILNGNQIENSLGINLDQISYVGFSAETTMTNIGNEQWNKETGLLSLWELGCMNTSSDNRVIIPLTRQTDSITEYFTKITIDRMQIKDGVVFYKADALGLNKIGTLPQFTKNVMGSYSKENNLLNIVTFNFENNGVYVNSLPENKAPYAGDVINIFNGNVDVSLNQNWPFYEFESSSSAKELAPKQSIFHSQTTYHFEGDFDVLNEISNKVLGVNLNDIPEF
ncbi:DUF6786 family protein [Seonamhaeicola maritimus]|uniref:DUF6786 family protein n=1 Tax=Seonamhaeicola maritimus TaxID=2591822 RepID=UPI002494FF18|nr:DUF6786 family protein [Seonamhaeicola maritimus]